MPGQNPYSLVSNKEGKFQIRLEKLVDSISFSFIGYWSKTLLPSHAGPSEWLEIRLIPNPKILDEVTVRPMPAIEIVKQAIEASIASLPKKNFSARAFYRETINDKDHIFP